MVRPSLSVELTRPFPALLKKGFVAKLSCQNGSVGCYSMYVESINGKQFCLIKHIRQSVCVHVWLHYHKLFFTVRHNRNARSCLVVVPQNVHSPCLIFPIHVRIWHVFVVCWVVYCYGLEQSFNTVGASFLPHSCHQYLPSGRHGMDDMQTMSLQHACCVLVCRGKVVWAVWFCSLLDMVASISDTEWHLHRLQFLSPPVAHVTVNKMCGQLSDSKCVEWLNCLEGWEFWDGVQWISL